MATHDYVIDNSTGANVRADLNLVLQAILSNNSSSSAPSTTAAYMWWADTTNGVLKIRNSANNAWVELLQLDGTLTLEDGSASTPALAFRDDLNTGIYQDGNDIINFSTSGVERLELSGTATVFNEDGADVDFRIEGDSEANLFYVDAGNNRIGIGTSTPSNVLDVQGGASNTSIVARSTDSKSQISLVDNSTTGVGSVVVGAEGDALFFTSGSGGSERMRIDSSGRLLLGLSSDSRTTTMIISGNSSSGATGQAILHMDIGTTSISDGTSLGVFRFGATGDRRGADIKAEGAGTWSAGSSHPTDLVLSTNASGSASTPTERMRIHSSGIVTVGDSSGSAYGGQMVVSTSTGGVLTCADTGSGERLRLEGGSGLGRIGTDSNHALTFITNGTSNERMRIDTNGDVGIGTTNSQSRMHLKGESGVLSVDSYPQLTIETSATDGAAHKGGAILFLNHNGSGGTFGGSIQCLKENGSSGNTANYMRFCTRAAGGSVTERLRINSAGNLTVNTVDDLDGYRLAGAGSSVRGHLIRADGNSASTVSQQQFITGNRLDSDGPLITFSQDGSQEGNISVSGSTVSYNGGHLSRWSQLSGISSTDKSARPTIYQGTVMSNLDELCEWSHADVVYKEDVCYTNKDTIPEGKSEGDVKHAKGSVLRAAYTEENQQLNMTKVSDVDGDKDVAGVFWTWDDDDDEIVNDFYVAMTGDMVIRVAASTTVARGDLLISAGDGTAKPQADDIIRSSTIAKIISTNHTATYADGSKAYPCVLMAC